jgi:hypothetical protein
LKKRAPNANCLQARVVQLFLMTSPPPSGTNSVMLLDTSGP